MTTHHVMIYAKDLERKVHLDGEDITPKLRGVMVNLVASDLPQVVLEVARPDVELNIDAEVYVGTVNDRREIFLEYLRSIDPAEVEARMLESHDMNESTGAAMMRALEETVTARGSD